MASKDRKELRRQLPAGPNKKEFSREKWLTAMRAESWTPDFQNLFKAGLFFDGLLTRIRAEKKLSQSRLRPAQLMRAILAISTHHYHRIAGLSMSQSTASRDGRNLNGVLDVTLDYDGNEEFFVDEIMTGLGDGLRHVLGELINEHRETTLWIPEPALTQADIEHIAYEVGVAVTYRTACEYWSECEGNGYLFEEEHDGRVVLRPGDTNKERCRTMSIYRRVNASLQNSLSLAAEFKGLSWQQKASASRVPLVARIYAEARVERVDLSFDEKTLDDGVLAAVEALTVEAGCYEELMDRPLPKFGAVTLRQLMQAWRVLESLARRVYEKAVTDEVDDIAACELGGPAMSHYVLTNVIERALRVDAKHAKDILAVFVFRGKGEQELWTQPLIRIGDLYYFVFPCILSVHLLRIAEGWMRQGGVAMAVRGTCFERFARKEIETTCARSDANQIFELVKNKLKLKLNGVTEDIDLVLVVGSTILLVEAKCILWPDDALQFANYFDTIEDAAGQIRRKAVLVRENYAYFRERMEKNGVEMPGVCPEIVSCVLVNSAIYAGLAFDGIPVIDLPILLAYIENSYLKLRQWGEGTDGHALTLRFYEGSEEAGRELAAYLACPPHLADLCVNERETSFRFPEQNGIHLKHRFYKVDTDLDAIKRKYLGEGELNSTQSVRYCSSPDAFRQA